MDAASETNLSSPVCPTLPLSNSRGYVATAGIKEDQQRSEILAPIIWFPTVVEFRIEGPLSIRMHIQKVCCSRERYADIIRPGHRSKARSEGRSRDASYRGSREHHFKDSAEMTLKEAQQFTSGRATVPRAKLRRMNSPSAPNTTGGSEAIT